MPDQVLGQGRVAIVYRSESNAGGPVARKIFIGSTLAELVNLVLLDVHLGSISDRRGRLPASHIGPSGALVAAGKDLDRRSPGNRLERQIPGQ